ncbi:DNA replication regulator SLD3 [Spathaspora sp. JA1]|nr:DNA replication regulator SLD3 [Spathaspora sp. JA1]
MASNLDPSDNGVKIHQIKQLSSAVISQIPVSTFTHDETGNLCSIIDSQYGTIFTFSREWVPSIHLVNIEYQAKQVQGIAFHITGEYFGIFRVPSTFESDEKVNEHELYVQVRNGDDLMSLCVEQPVGDLSPLAEDIIDRFSMAPPSKEYMEPLPQTEEEDASTFIQSRYYTTLYSLKNPLSYFPKTAIARLRILCKEDNSEIVRILKSVFVDIEQLHVRHSGPKGLLSIPNLESSVEKENQILFVKTHPEFKDDEKTVDTDKMGQLVLELKIREAQLQILVIFEILYTLGINQEEFLSTNATKLEKLRRKREKELAKRSLIRPRKGKRKIIPTFLGMGVGIETTEKVDEKKEIDDMYEYYTTLNNLIDRLGLWDALTTSKSDNNYGFMAYVVVPYYNKKLPQLVKYLVDNIKGSNMKLVSKPSKKPKKEPESADNTQHEQISKQNKHSKFKKVLLDKQPPTLRNAATLTSDLTNLSHSDDFLPSLKRSKSNLSSKSLTRRQVDLNVKQMPTEQDQEQNQPPSFIFGNAKRSKSIKLTSTAEPMLATVTKSKSFSQIESTPVKKSSVRVIEATPQKKRHLDQSVILKTPNSEFLKPSVRRETEGLKPLVGVTPQKIQSGGIKSPFGVEVTPMQQTVNSSPIKEITSSTRRKRPGEPIPLEDSPFYTAGLFNRNGGSPVGQQLFHSDSE